MQELPYEARYRDLLLPVVRVAAGKVGGSGTVIYSAQNEKKTWSTFILTNEHVVDSIIKVEKRWSTLLKREVKDDKLGIPTVDFFHYRWESRATGATSVETDVAAYDKDEDLALLKVRMDEPAPSVAKLFPKGKEARLRVSMPVYALGATMGEAPVMTAGMLSQFGREIENREYWLASYPSYFGSSGGALFLAETHEFIGVPARIAVTMLGFSADVIAHLSYAIPIPRVYKFLEEQKFRFIFDPAFTEEGEAAERKRLREREERRMAGEELVGHEEPSSVGRE